MASDTYIINKDQLDFHEQLGQGTNGSVYRVTWHRQDGDIQAALKKPNDVDRNEIDTLMALKHKHIIGYYGVVIQEPSFMIVMEYAHGGSLDRYLGKHKGSSLPLDQIIKWSLHLAHAVQYLHDKDYVHRDIKAGNCLISQDDELKLCDFHDARVLKNTVSTAERGSYPWMAPEVMRDQIYSKKSDIYSSAIVLWQMLSCQEVPYPNCCNGVQVMYYVCEHNGRPEIPKDCPNKLSDILTECWSSDRSERPNISQVLAKLNRAENEQQLWLYFMNMILKEGNLENMASTSVASTRIQRN